MKWFAAVVATLVACGKDSSAPVKVWDRWESARWEYSYTEPGWTEGLTSVAGTMVVERNADSIRVSSAGDVLGSFWGTTGADTTRAILKLWNAGLVVRGQVSVLDSTFWFIRANYPSSWVVPGTYITRGDTLTYAWVEADSVSTFSIVVTFIRP